MLFGILQGIVAHCGTQADHHVHPEEEEGRGTMSPTDQMTDQLGCPKLWRKPTDVLFLDVGTQLQHIFLAGHFEFVGEPEILHLYLSKGKRAESISPPLP